MKKLVLKNLFVLFVLLLFSASAIANEYVILPRESGEEYLPPYSEDIDVLKEYGVWGADEEPYLAYESLTRAEAISLLVRALNIGDDAVSKCNEEISHIKYTDISPEHWAYNYVYCATANNLINGYVDSTIKPDENILVLEFVIMAIRATGYEPLVEKAGKFHDRYMKTAYDIGITDEYINGYSGITREVAARILLNSMNIPVNAVVGYEMQEIINEDGVIEQIVVPKMQLQDGTGETNLQTLLTRLQAKK